MMTVQPFSAKWIPVPAGEKQKAESKSLGEHCQDQALSWPHYTNGAASNNPEKKNCEQLAPWEKR
jgi:hypothetical protein